MNGLQLKKYYVEPLIKYNIISVSVFKIINSYKDSEIYYQGLRTTVNNFRRFYRDSFYLRIYYDSSITKELHTDERINKEVREKWKPLIKELKHNPYVQLIKFRYSDFTKNVIYHDGLFGTLMRLLPLFSDDNDVTKVDNVSSIVISDIDISELRIQKESIKFRTFLASGSKFHFKTVTAYGSYDRFSSLDPFVLENIPYLIIASNIISKIRFPIEIFNNFLIGMSNLSNVEYESINNFIKNARITEGKLDERYKEINELNILNANNNFVYGIDEFFLNNYVLRYIYDLTIPFSYAIVADFSKPIYFAYQRSIQLSIIPKITSLFRDIMGKYYDESKLVSDNYTKLENIIYHKKRSQDNFYKKAYEYITKRIITTAKTLYKNNTFANYGFTPYEIMCLAHAPLCDYDFTFFDYKKNYKIVS